MSISTDTVAPRNLGRRCKCCRCEKRDWIDQHIRTGKSDVWISKGLADQGIDISRTGIWRHRSNCMGIKGKAIERNATDTEDIVPTPVVVDAEAVVADARTKAGKNAHLLSFMLREIATDQIAIVRSKQVAYMTGKGENPIDDIRALQAIHGILKEEAVVACLEVHPDASIDDKARTVAQAVLEGKLSPSNAERLLGVLAKQAEMTEYQALSNELDRLKAEVTGDED